MVSPPTPEPVPYVPVGCDQCPNRAITPRPFLHLTKANFAALILALCLFPCFFEQTDAREFRIRKEPVTGVLLVLLPMIGYCLGYDVIPKKS